MHRCEWLVISYLIVGARLPRIHDQWFIFRVISIVTGFKLFAQAGIVQVPEHGLASMM